MSILFDFYWLRDKKTESIRLVFKIFKLNQFFYY